jgi:phosphoglucomutase/phosphomannomutase
VLPWPEAVRSGRVHFLDDAPHREYIELCRRQSLIAPPKLDEFKVVFSPLHGVGSMTSLEVLVAQGFRPVPVEEQMKPDGQFPNVTKTPNPEIPECLDRAVRVSREVHADLALATDPDADRLGGLTATRTSPGPGGDWPMQFLNGNVIAALLTHFKLSKLAEQGRMPRSPIVVKTLVTTSLVTRIARGFGAQVVENLLVGFKYIAEVLWQLEQNGAYEEVQGTPEDFVLACEESHGILLTPQIRDKDAGAPALLMAELALEQKRRGRTTWDYLEALGQQYGYFRNEVLNVVMTGLEGKQNMAKMLDRLRSAPPREIGGLAVTGFQDLRNEDNWMGPIKGATDFAARNFLLFQLGDAARLALRPSGTEPKAKAYVEVCSPPCRPGTSAAEWQRTCQDVDAQFQTLCDDFLRQALAQ